MNKTIYMTYKKSVPDLVFFRWSELNKDYNIDFSLDNDCISFLEKNFNAYVADLFKRIDKGMYKADLWRLCKLYIHGGVYADVDLIPYINIDSLDKSISFYSCLSINNKSIFQAFMANFTKPKNPLILHFIISFLLNNPYTYSEGPTIDMYNCLQHNLNERCILPEKKYAIDEIKIKVQIGDSITNVKYIDLHYFPDGIIYSIRLHENPYNDSFHYEIKDNLLMVERKDLESGWGYDHCIDICIPCEESFFLFQENIGENNYWPTSYVTHENKKVFDSRDMIYFHNKGW